MRAQLDQLLHFQHTALNLRAYREQLISSNIANADTPNYKARDIEFGSALQKALQGGGSADQRVDLQLTSSRHIPASAAIPLPTQVKFRTELQSSVDGNTVDMDTERAAFAENSVQYEASLTFINGMLKTMQMAVTGQ